MITIAVIIAAVEGAAGIRLLRSELWPLGVMMILCAGFTLIIGIIGARK